MHIPAINLLKFNRNAIDNDYRLLYCARYIYFSLATNKIDKKSRYKYLFKPRMEH